MYNGVFGIGIKSLFQQRQHSLVFMTEGFVIKEVIVYSFDKVVKSYYVCSYILDKLIIGVVEALAK